MLHRQVSTPGQPIRDVLFSAERWSRKLHSRFDSLLQLADAIEIPQIQRWLIVREPLAYIRRTRLDALAQSPFGRQSGSGG